MIMSWATARPAAASMRSWPGSRSASPMAMFVAAVNGHLWYSCVTTAIRARSPSTSQSDSGRAVPAGACPRWGREEPAIIAARVVLPEPFSPTNAKSVRR